MVFILLFCSLLFNQNANAQFQPSTYNYQGQLRTANEILELQNSLPAHQQLENLRYSGYKNGTGSILLKGLTIEADYNNRLAKEQAEEQIHYFETQANIKLEEEKIKEIEQIQIHETKPSYSLPEELINQQQAPSNTNKTELNFPNFNLPDLSMPNFSGLKKAGAIAGGIILIATTQTLKKIPSVVAITGSVYIAHKISKRLKKEDYEAFNRYNHETMNDFS